jgi:hypothetical protein
MCLQFGGSGDVGRDRPCSRVLGLVYPSRTRGLLSDHKTGNAWTRVGPFSCRAGRTPHRCKGPPDAERSLLSPSRWRRFSASAMIEATGDLSSTRLARMGTP